MAIKMERHKTAGCDVRIKSLRHPVNITSYRKKDLLLIRDLCNPIPDSTFQNIDKYLNREGQTICLNCYEI